MESPGGESLIFETSSFLFPFKRGKGLVQTSFAESCCAVAFWLVGGVLREALSWLFLHGF